MLDKKVLGAVRPVYEMSKSPVHWFQTYNDYHETKLLMLPTTMDPCLVGRQNENSFEGFIVIQVDDTICSATIDHARDEEKVSQEYPIRGRVDNEEEGEKISGVELYLTEDKRQVMMKQQKCINCISHQNIKWV